MITDNCLYRGINDKMGAKRMESEMITMDEYINEIQRIERNAGKKSNVLPTVAPEFSVLKFPAGDGIYNAVLDKRAEW